MYEIRIVRPSDEREVVECINRITLHLHQKGVNQWEYPCNEEEIAEDIKKQYIWILLEEGRVLGTYSIKAINCINALQVEKGSLYLYRVAVLPELQGNNWGRIMVDGACQYAQNNNAALYLDCWAGNHKLRSFYQEVGFQHLGDLQDEDYYISVFKRRPYPGCRRRDRLLERRTGKNGVSGYSH